MIKYARGEKGEHVRDLQRRLQSEGFPLPRFGVDGDLGEEVVSAVESWALSSGCHEPVGDYDLGYLVKLFLLYSENNKRVVSNDRLVRLDPNFGGRHVKGLRQWSSIDSIVLHQTGCVFKLSLSCAIWHSVPIHVAVPRSENELGKFIKVNNLQALLWHAQGFNKRSIGIEIEGNFCGLTGDARTHWKKGGGPHQLMVGQVKAAKAAVRWIIECAEVSGANIKYIFAHRQSSRNRIADPGQEIWESVGRWAIEELGLSDGGKNFSVGRGYVLPDEWTGIDNKVGYYG